MEVAEITNQGKEYGNSEDLGESSKETEAQGDSDGKSNWKTKENAPRTRRIWNSVSWPQTGSG